MVSCWKHNTWTQSPPCELPHSCVLEPRVLDDDPAAAVVILNRHLQPQRALQPLLGIAHIGIDRRLRLRLLLLRAFRDSESPARSSLFGEQKAKVPAIRCAAFSISSACSNASSARAWPKLSSPASTRACTPDGNLQQTQEVRYRGAIFAGALRHLLLGHMELARQPLKRPRLLHRVQVGALQVLDDGDLHRLLVGNLAQNRRNGRSCRQAARRASGARQR